MDPVRFGFSLPNRMVMFGHPPDLLTRSAVAAEESGLFDSVWVGDNTTTRPRLEAMVLLGGLATITSRVKLGTACMATFPTRHPLQFAIEWAGLDVISGGRTILGVCNGGPGKESATRASELRALGVKSSERAARLEEGVELLRKLWGEGLVDHEGPFYRIENLDVLPKPVQDRIPIVIAVMPPKGKPELHERILRRVARLGDGWQSAICAPDLYKKYWSAIRDYAVEYGRDKEVTHASYHLMVNINDDASRAKAEANESLAKYYGAGFMTDEMFKAFCAYGPPGAVAERIEEYLEAGCTTPILRFVAEDQMAQLERCMTEVLPLVRPRGA